MCPGAEAQFEKVVKSNGSDGTGKINGDPRIDPRRAWLRKTFLDEILHIPYNFLW